MGEIMKSPNGVKSGMPDRVSISCPTCGTRHDLQPNNIDRVNYCCFMRLQLVLWSLDICIDHRDHLLTGGGDIISSSYLTIHGYGVKSLIICILLCKFQ